MPKFIAFLRAINVGNHTVKMDQLRRLFEELGFVNVETFIASGNVIFDTRVKDIRSLEAKIAKHLEKALGYEVSTMVRSTDELAAIAKYQPFNKKELDTEGNTLFIGFLSEEPLSNGTKKLMTLASEIDGFHVNQRELYWLYRRKNGESKFYGPILEKTVGVKATLRNANTIQRLAKKYCK
jgi:uncharacterized protein (DUF1697 family)